MLRAVAHAVVVNPDAELRRIAAEEGWEVLHLDRLGRRLKMLAAVAGGRRARRTRPRRSAPTSSARIEPARAVARE